MAILSDQSHAPIVKQWRRAGASGMPNDVTNDLDPVLIEQTVAFDIEHDAFEYFLRFQQLSWQIGALSQPRYSIMRSSDYPIFNLQPWNLSEVTTVPRNQRHTPRQRNRRNPQIHRRHPHSLRLQAFEHCGGGVIEGNYWRCHEILKNPCKHSITAHNFTRTTGAVDLGVTAQRLLVKADDRESQLRRRILRDSRHQPCILRPGLALQDANVVGIQ
jgi:hypothetical protein